MEERFSDAQQSWLESNDEMQDMDEPQADDYYLEDNALPDSGWEPATEVMEAPDVMEAVEAMAPAGRQKSRQGAYAPLKEYVSHGEFSDVTSLDTSRQFYSYTDLLNSIVRLRRDYGELMAVDRLTYSVMGREIPIITLGSRTSKKSLWVDASIHAREYMTSQIVMMQLEMLLKNYYFGEREGLRLLAVLRDICIRIVPMLNPDGVMLSQQGLECVRNPNRRKFLLELNQDSQDFTAWKANANGVDLNNNFDADWSSKNTGINRPAPEGYKGPYFESEPESQAVGSLLRHKPFQASLSFHAQGGEIYWYYKQEDEQYKRDLALAKKLSALTEYRLIDPEESLSGAGLRDYQVQAFKAAGCTIELGPSSAVSPIPIGDLETIYSHTRFTIWDVANWLYRQEEA